MVPGMWPAACVDGGGARGPALWLVLVLTLLIPCIEAGCSGRSACGQSLKCSPPAPKPSHPFSAQGAVRSILSGREDCLQGPGSSTSTAQLPAALSHTRLKMSAERRLEILSRQLTSSEASRSEPAVSLAAASSSSSSAFASATGTPSSYARIHGEASRQPARWRRIEVVAKEKLQDVKYEKSEGEGIAKVSRQARRVRTCMDPAWALTQHTA